MWQPLVVRADEAYLCPDVIEEQNEYLEGVLWADPEERCDPNPMRDISAEIDPFGTCTRAFWRGVLETCGTVAIKGDDVRQTPYIELKGSYLFLCKFLDFLQEEIHTKRGIAWQWDEGDAYHFRASRGKLTFVGEKAQQITRLLYEGQSVGRKSVRRVVDRIFLWSPKR